MFDLVPGMELTPTNPMTLKPHALKSPAQVGLLSFSFALDFCSVLKQKGIWRERRRVPKKTFSNLLFRQAVAMMYKPESHSR